MSPYLEGARLLLVEDNLGDAELIRAYLADTGEATGGIIHAETLADAVTALGGAEVDVVLLDLRLPDGSGVECVERVLEERRDLPIVVLTGLEDDELALACIHAGAQDYLCKQDLQPQALRRAIGYASTRLREASARRRVHELQARLAAIVESSSDAIVSSKTDGTITSWNRGAEVMFGCSSVEAVGRPITEVVRRPAGEDVGPLDRIADAEGSAAREVVRLGRDDRLVHLSVTASRLRDPSGAVVGTAAICRDITESKRRDEELRRRNEELLERDQAMRALTARLHAIREEERARISREVHDQLGQLLTGFKMDLKWIGRRLQRDDENHVSEAVSVRLREAEALVDQTIEAVQRIAVELRPTALDALGLASAVRDEARRFQVRAGIPVEVAVRGNAEPEPDVVIGLFRIFQELLTNAARHSKASTVRVDLETGDESVVLRVQDDGVGIEPGAETRPSSLGLLGVRERADSLGGTVRVERLPAGGTAATARVPLHQ